LIIPSIAIVVGLLLLVWSADFFVDGAAATANHLGMPPLLIGMIIVGFGTSAPEMVVSALASLEGSPGIALGNAFGSNIANIALILGLTALIQPITVESQVVRRELPILLAATALTVFLMSDGLLTRLNAFAFLIAFLVLLTWTLLQGMQEHDALTIEVEQELADEVKLSLPRASLNLLIGLAVLIVSSRLLVWGASDIARSLGISDVLIGLTVVALGTSLPELATSIIAARKGEHDMALGNIIGSNLFNTLAVVGIAGSIAPLELPESFFSRDMMITALLTVMLFIFSYGFRGQGRINRWEGAALLSSFFAYNAYLIRQTLVAISH
jgi:cation:H+ antiporter